jgi:hypothetical protein
MREPFAKFRMKAENVAADAGEGGASAEYAQEILISLAKISLSALAAGNPCSKSQLLADKLLAH